MAVCGCSVPSCSATAVTRSFHTLPVDRVRRDQWLHFIYKDRVIPSALSTKLRVCSSHFTDDCFTNSVQVNMGFAKRTLLKPGAVPTIYPGDTESITSGALPSSSQQENTHNQCPSTPLMLKDCDKSSSQQDTHSQCYRTPLMLKVEDRDKDKVFVQYHYQRSSDIGCQTEPQKKKSVSTQLSMNTLVYRRSRGSQASEEVHRRSRGSQASVLSVSVAIGTPVQWKRPPAIQSSTFRGPFKPSKRQRLKPDDDHGVFTDPYIPGESVSTESMLSQASPSINDVPKYIVDEYCLLQLFEDCPACGLMCEVKKTTRGTFLAVHQLCLQCNFSRNWKSQPLEAVPSGDPRSCTGDPESSAAAITEIIGFSDSDEKDSSDEGSSEVDQGEHNSDSDWDPLEHHNIDGKLADRETDADSESDANEEHEKDCRKLCPDCGTYFNSQNQRAHICEDKKPYPCIVCGKRFLCEFNLKAHNKTHEDGYKHVCKYCYSTFRTRTDKLVHEQSHPSAEKPYQCPDCPQVFAKMLERRDHLLSHRGPTKHICHICSMDFPSNSALDRHMVVHTNAKQFVCEVCQRSFTQSSHLKSHMRVHTGEKPYQCQHCDESFNHNVSLKSHIQRYHEEVPDSGMKVQIEKMRMNMSEVEKDETNQMDRSAVDVEGAKTDETESSCVDADEAEQSNTLCNPENSGDEEKKEKVGKRWSTGRPLGRPKKNAEKRLLCVSNERGQVNSDSTDEEQEHDSDSIFEPSKRKRRKKKKVNR